MTEDGIEAAFDVILSFCAFNPLMANGLGHCYYLGESNVILRGIKLNFEF